ncbi:hypothetical protein [Marmoricola sp. Leaf446]|uniref:hypothetical protein n=1 Tax=Marmoricola sp. Leaf446 TaxID=1736379 RepID=UPI0012E37C0E|nr:hypothetical protein [Marmoricola sp. Leaf446]
MDDGLAAAHPRLVMTVTHTWQWGLVTISDPHALEPPRGEGRVVADGHWVVLHVAHAQDTSAVEVGATVHVEVRDAPHPRTARRVLYDHVLLTPRGAVAIGDAEHEVVVPAHPERTAVRVSMRAGDDPDRLTDVWVELAPDPYADR